MNKNNPGSPPRRNPQNSNSGRYEGGRNHPDNNNDTQNINGIREQNHEISQKKKKKKHSKPFLIFKKIITVIATTLLSLFLVMIITGTIVATALTVYVLDFMEETSGITLQELESGSDTYFYGIKKNETTGEDEYYIMNRVKTDVQRIPVTIEQIPQHVRDAFVYTED